MCILMRLLVGQKRPAGRNLGKKQQKMLIPKNEARKRQLLMAVKEWGLQQNGCKADGKSGLGIESPERAVPLKVPFPQ